MLCGGSLMFLIGVARGELRHFDPARISHSSLGAFIYLVLIGAIIGYGCYAYILRHCDPAKVATYAYVNPVVAVLLGAFFAGEKINARMLVAAGLIVGSVAVVISGGRKRRRECEEIAERMVPAD
jgi:drug/metabolite transporter (DMT)-like permease